MPDRLPLNPNLRPPDVFAGMQLYQMLVDHQDSHIYARFLYRERLEVAGTLRKPSVLLIEGINDGLIPNNASRSLAWTMGPVPQVEPVRQSVPFLDLVSAPLTSNIDLETTAGMSQYVPAGVPGLDPEAECTYETNGHYCAPYTTESIAQKVEFLRSSIAEAAPVIIDPR